MSLKLNDKNRETIKQVFNLKANKVSLTTLCLNIPKFFLGWKIEQRSSC